MSANTIKLDVTRGADTPDFYGEGEYHADLRGKTVEAYPAFADRLIFLGYAKRGKDAPQMQPAEVPDNAPVFVERQSVDPATVRVEAQPTAPAIPTEEITFALTAEDRAKIAEAKATVAKTKKGSK